jgi:hypothetical protein
MSHAHGAAPGFGAADPVVRIDVNDLPPPPVRELLFDQPAAKPC